MNYLPLSEEPCPDCGSVHHTYCPRPNRERRKKPNRISDLFRAVDKALEESED